MITDVENMNCNAHRRVPQGRSAPLAPNWAKTAQFAPCVAGSSMSVSDQKRGATMCAHRHSGSWNRRTPNDAAMARLSFGRRTRLVLAHLHAGGHTLTVPATVVPRPPS